MHLRIAIQRVFNCINTTVPLSGLDSTNSENEIVLKSVNKLQEKLVELSNLETASAYNCLSSSSGNSSENNLQLTRNSEPLHIQEQYTTLKDDVWVPTIDQRLQLINLQAGIPLSKDGKSTINGSFWNQVEGVVDYERGRVREGNVIVSECSGGVDESSNNGTGGVKWSTLYEFYKTLPEEEKNSDFAMEETLEKTAELYFEDSKLYREMLKDFVQSSTTIEDSLKSNTSSSLTRDSSSILENSDLKGLGSSMKKTKNVVDRKGSKGRAVRYAVHAKLVNYMFPMELQVKGGNVVEDGEWFRSMFGGAMSRK